MISIVTTVFNGERFISSCFENVAQQKFREFEWLIVDDGSTDGSVDEIERAMRCHPDLPVRLIRSKKKGRGPALNLGVRKSTFDWIAILDIDDLWHPLKLQMQATVMRECLGGYGVLCTDAAVETVGREVALADLAEDDVPTSEVELRQLLLRSIFAHSTVLASRNLLKYDAERTSQFDLELWLRLLSGRMTRIVKIDLPLAVHLIHDRQNFESGHWNYGVRSIWLRLEYSVKMLAPYAAFYNCGKLLYYTLPRTVRMRITGRV